MPIAKRRSRTGATETTGDEHVLFDPNTMSDDGSVGLGTWVPSHDGAVVAYAVRENAADEAVLYVRDVATGTDLPDAIEGAKYAEPAWTPGGDGFYYTYLPTDEGIDVADRPGYAEVRYHRLGTDAADDPVIYPRTGSPQTFLGPALSKDGRLLTVTVMHGWNASDVYVRDLTRPADEFRPLVVGNDAIYWVTAFDGRLYILTNEGAPRYRVFRADADELHREAWREIVPESDATIESMRIVGGRLVLTYLRNASSELQVRTLGGVAIRSIELPGIGTVGGVVGTEDDDTAYYAYSSFVEPTRIFRTSIESGGAHEWARVNVPIDTEAYAVDQVSYPSGDGTAISMFLLHRRDLDIHDGDRPTLLYGYGGFNVSLTPAFSPTLPAWLDRGGIYAIPNLRGGGEYGEGVASSAGMLTEQAERIRRFHRRRRVPDQRGPHQACSIGHSRRVQRRVAGRRRHDPATGPVRRRGLRGATTRHAALPLVRQRAHLDTGVRQPRGRRRVRGATRLLPYHRVKTDVRYPPMLMLSADSDDRVDPMHARKFIAAVQHTGSSALLRIERQAGHGGADRVIPADCPGGGRVRVLVRRPRSVILC